MSAGAPERPASAEPDDLGFVRARMVGWLSPKELLRTLQPLVVSGIFGSYADKRELLGALPVPEPADYSARSELWIDYVADLGDGFDATYSIASLLAERELALPRADGPAVPTRRGAVLVMGGDQVYPSATIDDYEQRLVGPYSAALPHVEQDPPHLYAVPGNHDWYDGLTSFLRIFCQRKSLGAWQTQQRRSYFALQLPRRWWLWGVDMQFDTYIDAPQLEYFQDVAERLVQPGDQIILCAAKPSWVSAHRKDPEDYAHLDYFERRIVVPAKAHVRLALSGDAHHYARYTEVPVHPSESPADLADPDPAVPRARHKITAGGGGAYLSATHHLPTPIVLPPEASRNRSKSTPPVRYALAKRYPEADRSKRLKWGVFALPLHNRSFAMLVALVHAFYAWAVLTNTRDAEEAFGDALARISVDDVLRALVGSPLATALTVAIVVGMVGFTKTPRRHWGLGLAHGAVHLLVVVAVTTAAAAAVDVLPAVLAVPVYVAAAGVLGGLLGSLVFAAYLALADRWACNTNELFAAQRIEGYKNFVRLHLDEHGTLTVYPVGLERVAHAWRSRPGDAETPWLEPDGPPLQPVLIEGPITLEGNGPDVGGG